MNTFHHNDHAPLCLTIRSYTVLVNIIYVASDLKQCCYSVPNYQCISVSCIHTQVAVISKTTCRYEAVERQARSLSLNNYV